MGKEKRPLQSERINRYLFCFWFQVIRQDDLSNRDFPQFLFHPMGEADRLCRTAGFPSVIYSDHSVGVLHHIAVSVPEQLTGVSQVVAAGDATRESLEKYPVGGLIYLHRISSRKTS